ncbi:MAG TPA: squalene synthase HpnC [Caulobacteraceae bacterium]|jgi:squalene synthase HpnC
MSDELASGKGHRDENFPVASFLIARRHRAAIMAFYKVARMADDIADNPTAAPREKDARLAAIEASLTGASDEIEVAAALREIMASRAIPARHILDLLEAFRRDVRKIRYESWAELMDYCRYSAAPVGRYVLAVHGQSPATWPASDALCSALQVINHLQDCAQDFQTLNRVYLPLDSLSAAGVDVTALCASRASPALAGVIADLSRRCQALLATAQPLAGAVRDTRLRLEIGVIRALAVDLAHRLTMRDPLSERVHHRPLEALGAALLGGAEVLFAKGGGSAKAQTGAIGGA